ncbi:MAG: DUF1517 domain-containing protein [Cyanobacteria bacterium J06621_11]
MSKLFWRKQLIRGAIRRISGLAIATLACIVIVGGFGPSTPQIHFNSPNSPQPYIGWETSHHAIATSGGRSSGGSFGSSSDGGSSSGGSSSGGSSSGGSSNSDSYNYSSGSSSSSYSSGSGSSEGNLAGLIFLIFFIPVILIIFYVGNAIQAKYLKTFRPKEYAYQQKKLGAMKPNYLMVYELLWSPQDSSDSLTYEEMLLGYPYMIQIC